LDRPDASERSIAAWVGQGVSAARFGDGAVGEHGADRGVDGISVGHANQYANSWAGRRAGNATRRNFFDRVWAVGFFLESATADRSKQNSSNTLPRFENFNLLL
jgi:hypothetical protein